MKLPLCPICKKPVELEGQVFCSERCERIDLGNWLGEKYATPAEDQEIDESVLEEPE